MPFMLRNRRELSIITTALIFCSVLLTPARGEYNPKLGRFMQRDPNETALCLMTALVSNGTSREVECGLHGKELFSEALYLYQYTASNPVTQSDPSGRFTLLGQLVNTSIQAQLAALYMDPSITLVEALKGIALMSCEKSAVLDTLLGTETKTFDFSAIDAALRVYDAWQLTILAAFGVGAGIAVVKGGLYFARKLAARAGGVDGLKRRLNSGTKGLRSLFRILGKRGAPAKFGWARNKSYRSNFLEHTRPVRTLPDENIVVHHAVEQHALDKYPDAVRWEEIHSVENLRGMPKSRNSEIHLRRIRARWREFYATHPHATKHQLLDQATAIDDEFGHLFHPKTR